MTETMTAAPKTRRAKNTASPRSAIPKFDLPKIQEPVAFRELSEKGVAQTNQNHENIPPTVKEMTASVGSTVAKGVTNPKWAQITAHAIGGLAGAALGGTIGAVATGIPGGIVAGGIVGGLGASLGDDVASLYEKAAAKKATND